jgi:hypothetical protein
VNFAQADGRIKSAAERPGNSYSVAKPPRALVNPSFGMTLAVSGPQRFPINLRRQDHDGEAD